MAKKKIDPAFKAAQQQNKLIAWAYPSKVKNAPTRVTKRDLERTNLERRNAEAAAEQERRVKERRARAEAAREAKKKPLKEYYKQILSEMGKVPTTPQQKKLAAHYGDKNRITRGDVITAAKMKQGLDEKTINYQRNLRRAVSLARRAGVDVGTQRRITLDPHHPRHDEGGGRDIEPIRVGMLISKEPTKIPSKIPPGHSATTTAVDKVRQLQMRGAMKRIKNRITRGDVITAAKKKQGLDEMALTKAAMKQELKKLRKAERRDDRRLSTETGREVQRQTDALSQLLRSKDLYHVDSKGGLTKVGELKGRRAAGELTGAAMFGMRGNRLSPETLGSAKELVKKHGMFYTGQDWDDEQLHPLAQTAAIGGKRGPTTPFLRPAKATKKYRDY